MLNTKNILTIEHLHFQGNIQPPGGPHEVVENFSCEFNFGKSYLLNAPIGAGAWALSWIIAGVIQETQGTIKKNDRLYDISDRKKDAWLVRHSEIKRFGIFSQSVQKQIRHGLRTKRGHYLLSENEYIRRFNLSIERYDRLLRQFSHEGWRASCAVGMANVKSVYCFPHIASEFLAEHLDFKELFDLLKSSNALVLVPTNAITGIEGLFDEVVNV